MLASGGAAVASYSDRRAHLLHALQVQQVQQVRQVRQKASRVRKEFINMANFPSVRLRRTRQNARLRGLVRETRLSVEQLIYPLFVAEGLSQPREIASMPGIMQWPLEHLGREVERIAQLGIPAVLLFGIPNEKDEVGSQAYNPQGIIQQAIRVIKVEAPG